MEKKNADVICLQEIRADEISLKDTFQPAGYHNYYKAAKKKGYSGVAIYTREKPDQVIDACESDMEGRYYKLI